MRTKKDLSNIILKAQCCVADMAYKSLKQEMFLKADASRIHKNVKFLHALVNILNRYYDVVYVLNDTDVWLTDEQIEDILQQINLLCDNCGCCTDRDVIIKDIN